MADRYIPEHRRTQFKAKNTFKPEELRRRREEQQVEIRKAKREENLAKRRGIGTGDNRPGASLGAAPDSDDDTVPTESQVCLPLSSMLNLPLHLCPALMTSNIAPLSPSSSLSPCFCVPADSLQAYFPTSHPSASPHPPTNFLCKFGCAKRRMATDP